MKRIAFLVTCFALSMLALLGKELDLMTFIKNYQRMLFKTDEPMSSYTMMVFTDNHVYFCDRHQCKIFLFSKEGKLLKSFGSRGEAPQEFDSIIDLQCVGDFLYVTCFSKLSIWTKKGEFVKEIRHAKFPSYQSYFPAKNNYIAWAYDIYTKKKGDKFIVYYLVGPNLEKKKELFQVNLGKFIPPDSVKKGIWRIYPDFNKGVLYKDKFFIGCTNLGFYISVFDLNGNKLYDIKKDYEKIKVTSEMKERFRNKIRKGIGESAYKAEMSKRDMVFPEYMPAFVNFFVDNEKIYIFRYSKQASKMNAEVLLLDLKGNLIGKFMMPVGILDILEFDKSISFQGSKLYLSFIEKDDNYTIRVVDIGAIFKAGYE